MQSTVDNLIALSAAIMTDRSIPELGLANSTLDYGFVVATNGVQFMFERVTYSQDTKPPLWIGYRVNQIAPAVPGTSHIWISDHRGSTRRCRIALSGALVELAHKEARLRGGIHWTPDGQYK